MAGKEYERTVRRNRDGVGKEELEHSVDCCDDARVKDSTGEGRQKRTACRLDAACRDGCGRGHRQPLAELAKHTMFVKILGSYPNVNG